MLAEYPPKVLEVLSLKRFFPQCQVYKCVSFLNNIAHKKIILKFVVKAGLKDSVFQKRIKSYLYIVSFNLKNAKIIQNLST